MFPTMYYHEDGRNHIAQCQEEADRLLAKPGWSLHQPRLTPKVAVASCEGCQKLQKQVEDLKTRAQKRIDELSDQLTDAVAATKALQKEHDKALADLATATKALKSKAKAARE